ncbi:MAG: pitrilysin family protein, partial [Exiguobacterium oxidotolerans]
LVRHETLLEEALDLLEQMIFYPDLTEGGFREQFVKQEKRLHALRISSLYDDKMRFAQQRLLELMAPGEAVSLSSLGTLEGLEEITTSSLRDTYRSMIENDRIDVFVVGHVTRDEMEEALSFLPSHSEKTSHYIPALKQVAGVKRSSETQPIKQGKLHLGYRVAVDPTSADSIRMQIVNGLFGGFPHSKLFMNVREKESLAYYAASRYAALNGALYVYSGVETQKAERAETIIKEQLVDLKAGNFTAEELTQTKAMLINARRQILDQPGQLIGWLNGSKMRGLTLEDEIHIIETATREDVVRLAAKIELEAVYLLRGEE